MKILICNDGSEHSKRAVDFAARLIGTCSVEEAAIIYVYESTPFLPDYWHGKYPFSAEEKKRLQKIDKRIESESKELFTEAVEKFAASRLTLKTIFEVGHPAETIARVADEGGYELVIIGRRGAGGVKNLLIGSTSSAVLQMVKSNVLMVK